jgi:hypothetical protein
MKTLVSSSFYRTHCGCFSDSLRTLKVTTLILPFVRRHGSEALEHGDETLREVPVLHLTTTKADASTKSTFRNHFERAQRIIMQNPISSYSVVLSQEAFLYTSPRTQT